MTWEQWHDWQLYYQAEPWGEDRADWRALANTLWQASSGGDRPNLVWPYFGSASEMWSGHEELEKRRKELGPDHEAKLRAARVKYWEEKKKREGNGK